MIETPPLQGAVAQMLLQYEIEQFLYQEAAILDERRLWDWLDLLTDDVEYWMPIRSTRSRGDEADEFTKPGEAAFFDENRAFLEERVRKLDTGFAWAEDPPSRTRHLVSNVRLLDRPAANELHVSCNFVVYRTRLSTDEDLWVGRREDTLRQVDGAWKIARRHVFLDQVVLKSKNLSIFF
jgi:3-phenylpropionate/cinnamic acid dioxygenase small subunit